MTAEPDGAFHVPFHREVDARIRQTAARELERNQRGFDLGSDLGQASMVHAMEGGQHLERSAVWRAEDPLELTSDVLVRLAEDLLDLGVDGEDVEDEIRGDAVAGDGARPAQPASCGGMAGGRTVGNGKRSRTT